MILNGTGDNLQAFMSGAAATTNPSFFVTYADINSTTSALTPDSAGGALNGTTDVNLVSGVAGAKRMIKNLAICNVDTAAVVITVQFEDGTDRPVQSAVSLPVGKTLYWSLETGWVIQPDTPRATFRGARVFSTTSQSIASAVSEAADFANTEFDTDDIHDDVTNNTRLTVPTGVTMVQLSGLLGLQADASPVGYRQVTIEKNGAPSDQEPVLRVAPADTSTTYMTTHTGPIAVVGGDYFELVALHNHGSALTLVPSSLELTWFAMEILQ